MLEEFTAALKGSLQKVEPTSTSCLAKKLRDMFISGYVTLGTFPATCIAPPILRDKLQERLPSVIVLLLSLAVVLLYYSAFG